MAGTLGRQGRREAVAGRALLRGAALLGVAPLGRVAAPDAGVVGAGAGDVLRLPLSGDHPAQAVGRKREALLPAGATASGADPRWRGLLLQQPALLDRLRNPLHDLHDQRSAQPLSHHPRDYDADQPEAIPHQPAMEHGQPLYGVSLAGRHRLLLPVADRPALQPLVLLHPGKGARGELDSARHGAREHTARRRAPSGGRPGDGCLVCPGCLPHLCEPAPPEARVARGQDGAG